MNVVKKQIKKDANKQRRADSKKAVDTDESTNQVAGIGHQGLNFKFKVSDLINHAKQYPVKQVDPNVFKAQLVGRQEDPTKSGQRAANADLSYPIIVVKFNDGSLMIADGTHRVQKAISLQQKINARIIPVNDMQKFRVANLSDNQPQKNTQSTDVEEGPSDMGMNKYGLSATKFGDKFKSYQHGKLTGEFDTIEQLQKHQAELIQDKPVDEAPFGAVKKAINKAKKVVGRVPGLGDMKTKADAEANIGKVANDVWKDYLQFKQTDPDAEQVKGWFKTNHGMDVEPDANANVDQDSIMPGIKQAMAAKQSRTKATPDATPDNAQDVKVKIDLLKKSDPNASPVTLHSIKKMAAGEPVVGDRQKALQPLMLKIAKALNNPGKANILSRALAESLSQQDLSKLDMLARQGMVPKNKISRFKTAMRTLAKGKDLPISYKDDVIDVVMKLSKIITKPSVMGMVRKGLREQQDPKNLFDSWVKQGKEKHNI